MGSDKVLERSEALEKESEKVLIQIEDMRKIYNPGENEVHALDGEIGRAHV